MKQIFDHEKFQKTGYEGHFCMSLVGVKEICLLMKERKATGGSVNKFMHKLKYFYGLKSAKLVICFNFCICSQL